MPASNGWRASLQLGFSRRDARTLLSSIRHTGPLRVQKALYPEGESVCHAIMLHPPAGIVGGDALTYDIALEKGAHALLTTPGAGKWYGSDGRLAQVKQSIRVAEGAVCEWLPQESIVYDAARGQIESHFELEPGAALIAADLLCLGRIGSGERFRRGSLSLNNRLSSAGQLVWLERGVIEGGSELLASPVGLAGQPVVATLMAMGGGINEALRDACRELDTSVGECGVTLLPNGLLLARWLGPATEPARQWMTRMWACLRPAVAGRAVSEPRIWRT